VVGNAHGVDPHRPGHLDGEHRRRGAVPEHLGQQVRGVQRAGVPDNGRDVRAVRPSRDLGFDDPLVETGYDGPEQLPVAV